MVDDAVHIRGGPASSPNVWPHGESSRFVVKMAGCLSQAWPTTRISPTAFPVRKYAHRRCLYDGRRDNPGPAHRKWPGGCSTGRADGGGPAPIASHGVEAGPEHHLEPQEEL